MHYNLPRTCRPGKVSKSSLVVAHRHALRLALVLGTDDPPPFSTQHQQADPSEFGEDNAPRGAARYNFSANNHCDAASSQSFDGISGIPPLDPGDDSRVCNDDSMRVAGALQQNSAFTTGVETESSAFVAAQTAISDSAKLVQQLQEEMHSILAPSQQSESVTDEDESSASVLSYRPISPTAPRNSAEVL